MGKFDLLSIKCRMCDWQWEIKEEENIESLFCMQCGSEKLEIQKQKLHMLKKGGKFITDIGFSHPRDKFGSISVEEVTSQNKEPLLVVKKDDIKISEEMTDEDLKNLLSQMNSIKSKILDEIELNREELINRLL